MRQSNLKSWRSSLTGLCLLCVVVSLGVQATTQEKTKPLKDVFKDDFKIGAALKRILPASMLYRLMAKRA